jgi:SAF domain
MKGPRNLALGLFGLGLIAISLHPVGSGLQAAASAGAPAPVVVAARPIAQGTAMTANDVRIAFEAQPPAGVFSATTAVVGRTAAVNIRPGRVIDDAVLATVPVAARQTVGVHLDSHAAVLVAPGDVVEVLTTDAAGTAETLTGDAVVEDVASGSGGTDVTLACAAGGVPAVVGAQLQGRPLAVVRVSAGR